MVLGFLVAVVLMVSNGIETLIPENGEHGRQWIADIQDSGKPFSVGAWLAVFAGLFDLVALVGFYDALRQARPVMIVAPVVGVVGMTVVTISQVLPVAMASELAPGYAEADGATPAASP